MYRVHALVNFNPDHFQSHLLANYYNYYACTYFNGELNPATQIAKDTTRFSRDHKSSMYAYYKYRAFFIHNFWQLPQVLCGISFHVLRIGRSRLCLNFGIQFNFDLVLAVLFPFKHYDFCCFLIHEAVVDILSLWNGDI